MLSIRKNELILLLMKISKHISALVLSLLFIMSQIKAQSSVVFDTIGRVEIPVQRQKLHEDIDKEQKRTDKVDGKIDQYLKLSDNEDLNVQITDVILRKVDEIQMYIERMPGNNNTKVGYLRSLKELLQAIGQKAKQKDIPAIIPQVVSSYEECMERISSGKSLVPVFEKLPYQGAELLSAVILQSNELPEIKKITFLKKAQSDPSFIMKGIEAFENEPFADSLVVVAAEKTPLEVYTYAQATKTIAAKIIRRSKNQKVQTIAKLSAFTNGTLYLPFLDELLNNNLTTDDVKAVAENELAYYKLLVKTQIKYFARISSGDTPVLADVLFQMLERKATDAFVNVMNELHNETNPAVRFRVAVPLTSQEIYYLIVTTEEVIYTSTFTYLYKQMMDRFPGRRSDSLLINVHFDKFKKFIKMAANYNCLDDFLKAMPELHSNQLMYAFVNGLQKTNSLEDAVDVADSYGSITDVKLQNFVKDEIKKNFDNSVKENDNRGQIIYNILGTLFQSASDTSINLSALLGIPPVYKVDYNSLSNGNNGVVQHVFFYGDEDGLKSYSSFMGLFTNKTEWQVNVEPEWVVIKSLKSAQPYTIYANRPLDNKTDKDALAQQHLIEYLEKNNIKPTFVVHRGHSYHLKYTIQQMLPSSRIVMLGSCGGYQNLAKILNVNEDAHIISTKQVGTFTVNEPILRAINETIRNGRNVDWIPLWKQIENSVKSDAKANELFKDYVPPHKNLGAIFIKAYRKATGEM